MSERRYMKIHPNKHIGGYNLVLRIPILEAIKHKKKYGYWEPYEDIEDLLKGNDIYDWVVLMNLDEIHFWRENPEDLEKIMLLPWVQELHYNFMEEENDSNLHYERLKELHAMPKVPRVFPQSTGR